MNVRSSTVLQLVVITVFSIPLISPQTYTYSQAGDKRKCYNCNMPYQCSAGVCYGDVCVKSLASGRYVSKGCENRTSRAMVGMPTGGYGPNEPKSMCSIETLFDVETEICYCTDIDFCNSAPKVARPQLIDVRFLCLTTLLIFRFRWCQ